MGVLLKLRLIVAHGCGDIAGGDVVGFVVDDDPASGGSGGCRFFENEVDDAAEEGGKSVGGDERFEGELAEATQGGFGTLPDLGLGD